MPLISILIPVYNVEQYLCRCVDSVLSQSFPDIEIILIDDGSPDGCGVICDTYAEKNDCIHVIHQKNGGLSAARNAGLDWLYANSDCEWITFVDSDDWLHPNFLEFLYQNACIHNCRLSAGGFYITSGESLPEQLENAHKSMTADDYYCTERYSGYQVTACGKLYHRSLLKDLRFPVGKLHEDEFMTYRTVYTAERIAVSSAPLYAYYQNQSGIMKSTWNPRRLDALEAIQGQIAFAKENNNVRLFYYATDAYVWNLTKQITWITEAASQHPEYSAYEKKLKSELRHILKEGLHGRKYPLNRNNLELYEVAYPLPVWKLLHGTYGAVKKMLKK